MRIESIRDFILSKILFFHVPLRTQTHIQILVPIQRQSLIGLTSRKLAQWNSPMRYHSPFMMKSDKSPPSSELSTRSSYQGQSLIKMGTYLHDGDISLGNSKPNVRMQLRILLASVSTSTTRLRNSASTNRRYVIRRATKENPFGRGTVRRRDGDFSLVRHARLEKRVRAVDRRKTALYRRWKLLFAWSRSPRLWWRFTTYLARECVAIM